MITDKQMLDFLADCTIGDGDSVKMLQFELCTENGISKTRALRLAIKKVMGEKNELSRRTLGFYS